jgi:GDPmannose 4,6-dehydratase
MRRTSSHSTERADHLYRDPHESDVQLRLHHGGLTHGSAIARLARQLRPDDFDNFAAQSHVAVALHQPESTGDLDGLGLIRLREAIREADVSCKLCQADASGRFGDAYFRSLSTATSGPARPTRPRRSTGTTSWRTTARRMTCSRTPASCFAHESPRRGETFVTRKITRAVARLSPASQDTTVPRHPRRNSRLGLARDVIGMGESYLVREFYEFALGHVGPPWERFVQVDPAYCRPTAVDNLHVDPACTMVELGWEPQMRFQEHVEEIVEFDLTVPGLSLDEGWARVAELERREVSKLGEVGWTARVGRRERHRRDLPVISRERRCVPGRHDVVLAAPLRTLAELRRGGMAIPAYALTADYGREAANEYPQIKPEGLVLDVPDVHLEPRLPTLSVPAVDLCPAGHAGTDLVTPRLPGRVAREVFDEQRPWSDQTHVSPHHVPQLGEFVEARRPQEPAERSQPLHVRQQLPLPVAYIGHCPELEQRERFPMEPRSLLPEEDRPTELPPDQHSEGPLKRCGQRETQAGENEVEEAFEGHWLVGGRGRLPASLTASSRPPDRRAG